MFMSGWMGIDLSGYDLDEPLTARSTTNAIQSAVDRAPRLGDPAGRRGRVRDIAAGPASAGSGPVFVGDPGEVADQLQEWVEETDVDGFNLAYAITPGTFEDIVEHVVPELQRRGVHRTEYGTGSLRNKLLGTGDRLPDRHGGAGYRRSLPIE